MYREVAELRERMTITVSTDNRKCSYLLYGEILFNNIQVITLLIADLIFTDVKVAAPITYYSVTYSS